MTKVILHLTKAAIAAITALLVFSCNMEHLNGNGKVTVQKRQVSNDFKSIKADRTVEVIIEQGPEQSVTVEADDNFQQHIKCEVRNGELAISSDKDFAGDGTKKVYVTLPVIEKINASAAASVTSRNNLKGRNIELSADSAASIDVAVQADELILEANSASNIKVRGKVNTLQADASSAGTINAKGLTAKTVNAESSSAGTVYVNPVESLSARASSTGSVIYIKTPEKLDMKTSSGGNIEQD